MFFTLQRQTYFFLNVLRLGTLHLTRTQHPLDETDLDSVNGFI